MTKYVEDTLMKIMKSAFKFLSFLCGGHVSLSYEMWCCYKSIWDHMGHMSYTSKSRSFWGSYQPSLQRVWNPPQYRASHWISTDQYRASNCVQVKLKKNALKRATADGGHVDHVGASWIVIEVVRMKNDWRILSFIWHVEVSGWQLQLIITVVMSF